MQHVLLTSGFCLRTRVLEQGPALLKSVHVLGRVQLTRHLSARWLSRVYMYAASHQPASSSGPRSFAYTPVYLPNALARFAEFRRSTHGLGHKRTPGAAKTNLSNTNVLAALTRDRETRCSKFRSYSYEYPPCSTHVRVVLNE